jgi:mRNA-degrading endonuclease RelE of RelBE toxin-antitoxin system
MGRYTIEISQDARKHLQKIHKSGNNQLIKKVEQLF